MTLDEDAYRHLLQQVAEDDARVGWSPEAVEESAAADSLVKVGWVCSRDPLLGGEYYRATRPAMLSSKRFGWHTIVGTMLATPEDDDEGPVAVVNPYGQAVVPDVIVVRPVRDLLPSLIDNAHRHGQMIVADLDDDVWGHEDWTPDDRPNDDGYETWCYDVDAWLVSTEAIRERVIERYRAQHKDEPPILVAPNCFDPHGFANHPGPRPGRRIGTRLWLSGRMQSDLDLYAEHFAPLLEQMDLEWVHIGYEPGQSRSFVESCQMPADRVHLIGSKSLMEMGAWLAATCSIGAIALSDHPFNRAKTLTHAVELASAGLPLVIMDRLGLYGGVPGVVTASHIPSRVDALVHDRRFWAAESLRSIAWAQKHAAWAEAEHLLSLEMLVKEMIRTSA